MCSWGTHARPHSTGICCLEMSESLSCDDEDEGTDFLFLASDYSDDACGGGEESQAQRGGSLVVSDVGGYAGEDVPAALAGST